MSPLPGAGLVRAWCGPGAGLVRAWCGPGAGLVRAWCGPGAGRLGLVRAFGPGAGLVRAWCGPGAGLVRAWCGPGAGLVRAWCGPWCGLVRPLAILLRAQDCFTQSCCGRRIASLNPVVGAGLLYSILLPQQDCPDAAPAALAWSRSCPSTAL